MQRICLALAIAAAVFDASGASGQNYLSQPVKIVVPTGPGTIADTVTRMMAQDLSTQFGQTFIVENRVGANGIIGAGAVANAAPDGTTFIVGNVSTHAANEFLYAKLPYDPTKDFTPVSLVGTVPHMLIVPSSSPAKTFAELVDEAKKNPGKMNFGSGSSPAVVAMEVIKRGAGINTLHVPFRTTPQAATELLSGRIDMMVSDFGVARPLIDSGKVRPLLATMTNRSPALPDVPAFADVGLPELDIVGWFAWFAPAGTPQEAVNRIYEGLKKATAQKEFQTKLAAYGIVLTGTGPDELGTFRKEQRSIYERIIKEAGIKPQ